MRNLFVFSLLLLTFSFKANCQKELKSKDQTPVNIVHRGLSNTTFFLGVEQNFQYQLGFRKKKNNFLMGLGPGFFKQYFDDNIFFIGVATSLEYNYGIKWRFVTGVNFFHGWISDKSAVQGIGPYFAPERTSIAIPVGFMYNSKSGFFVGLDYQPYVDLASGSIDYLCFRLRLGFEALKK